MVYFKFQPTTYCAVVPDRWVESKITLIYSPWWFYKKEVFQMKVYSYNKCGTCRKAIRFLEDRKVKFELIDITETPPTKQVLKAAVKAKGLKKLFNTSGVQYRELKIKDKLGTMTESQAIDLLASNGRLVKRPIAVEKDKITVGFDIEEYKKVW